ncbi:hypothetical protein DRW48_05760 [Paracoccus suum]|uniref:RcnB family protein n=1 Tax=Paracoccus suum TaxID=2259340 RepID=A0A344PIP9_9RHOB|nr:hypothetical protein [Paracoccus suum]AXC49254.1 hypothetical protein DRW48_05760 [Paracoccus suum]
MMTASHRLAGAIAAVIALGIAAPAAAKCPPGQAKKGNCSVEQSHKQGPGKGAGHKDNGKHKANKSSAKEHGKPTQVQRAAVRPHRAAVPVVAAGSAAAAAAAAGKGPVVVDRLTDDGRIVVGDSLGISRYRRIADPRLFDLPARSDGLAYYRVGDRIVLADPRDYRVREFIDRPDSQRFCPPGLAKKEPACIPPGQVDKIMRTQWDRDRFLPITDYARYGLAPPRDNWGYYVVDNAIVRVDQRSHEILSLVRLMDAIL